ncbi:Sterol-4-alpha-carboxylate 3-dehydrogenase, decarboxylating [Sparassis crispa]|uniref:Sterol-4-alpha-carboxylate 3-dehydrogenase, decarboxylating n=1 Tax=Sparassis crispa TaxID=139825 RepID=A0A401GZ26_9APHY|nr:Sterol-4-alpha-carboxylate 3-dehydrogenase, decarboxylating [Sparassis crispa]GBE87415.1 Sterol-4-alpha-carboxylate 3-dehydrogenase, decarboxylating [Sparassis crispa]
MPDSYLITGGNGLLGRQIVRLLLERGETSVAVFDVRVAPGDLDERVRVFTGDITKDHEIDQAIQDCQATCIIHTAALIGFTGHGRDLLYRVNVGGTKLVVDAAVAHGVSKLVYTSSASAVFAGKDQAGVDETVPYPEKPLDEYSDSKAQGERIVLEANGRGSLRTCALRVAGLFGPGDRVAVPGYMGALQRGRTNTQIGNNTNVFDNTYIDNAAYAHLLAADRLDPAHPKHARVAGEPFFITNGEPRRFWDVPRAFWRAAGWQEPKKFTVIPRPVAFFLASVLEFIGWLIGWKPPLTRYLVIICTTTRWCNISKAKDALDYEPLVSLDEGIKRSVEWYFESRKSTKKQL